MNYKNQKGVNLMELLVALAIIGIIAAIGYPSYIENTQKANRRDANAMLAQFAQAMERYYSVNYSYEDAAESGADTGAPATATFGFTQSPQDGVAAYNLTISAASATTFTVSATPTGSQVTDVCGTLTLNSAGVRGHGGSADDDCW